MNSILNYTSENGIQMLSYGFEKMRNIDDIAMHILNELTSAGFIPSAINKSNSTIEFDIARLKPCLNETVFRRPEDMYCIFADLHNALSEMRRCRIDSRYLVHELNAICRHQDSGLTFFAVVPCIEIFSKQRSLKELLLSIIEEAGFRHLIDAGALETLKNTAQFAENDEKLPEDLMRSMKKLFPECAGIIRAYDVQPVLSVKTEQGQSAPTPEPQPENAVAEAPSPEEPAPETEKEPAEPAKKETRTEHVPAPSVNVPDSKDDEEWLSRLKEGIRQEILAEKQKKRNGYLIRRQKGEIISLSEDVFIIGKAPEFCDYVIGDNPSISKLHAMIRYQESEDSYVIIDCDSTNHIYLNARQIPSEQAKVLEDNMIIHLASEAFIFRR